MYWRFFGLREKPFALTPDPRFLFYSRNHKEAFAHLLFGIRDRTGFIEITGEVGTGKTTVLRTLFRQLEEEGCRLALIFNPSLSAKELLRAVNREFGLAAEGLSGAELLEVLNDFLLVENAAGRTVVLVVDEAQNLEAEVLEQIRLLSNLETETEKLIQIVLVGQPELGAVLAQPGLRQLSQRIGIRYHLQSMNFRDTRAYIRHRLAVAGSGESKEGIFSTSALRVAYRHSQGLPRLINVICDRSLLVAYGEDRSLVSARHVRRAIGELNRRERRSERPSPARRVAWLALVAVLTSLIAGGGYLWRTGFPDTGSVSASPPEVESPPSAKTSGERRAVSGARDEAGVAPAPLSDVTSLRRALAAMTALGTLNEAFAGVVDLWGLPAVDFSKLPSRAPLTETAKRLNMELSIFTQGLDRFLQLDYPAIVPLILPGEKERRYLGLLGREGKRFRVSPAIDGRRFLALEELRSLWSGQALILWKNYRQIPSLGSAEVAGPGVRRLQEMLLRAGVLASEPSGVYDQDTIRAITRFQARSGLVQDGRAGPHTLMALYYELQEFPVPRLGAGREAKDP